ncbi:poly(U)-binding-splicing factor PUF60-like isoform X2 [Stegodyphus dumicola]|uniref:poly(U)-binding-splicing factor PUF60-like isoform X2 n=1 Tax=Stegodyphus dumicola TaxID=202533 RepID=UPI0015B31252|nr:poly(U)-binding-splicing factor PUF60-like isoform X2 [Stegodyphus dumicola]
MQEIMRPAESSVIVLRNMVDVEGIDDELEVDLRSECEKFGIVNQITVYQERQSEDDDAEIIVKIFVKFRLPSVHSD